MIRSQIFDPDGFVSTVHDTEDEFTEELLDALRRCRPGVDELRVMRVDDGQTEHRPWAG
jgi:hypothetical protein